MSKSIEGKVAIITGSSRGIGKAVALALAEKGVKIVLNARNREKLEETNTEFNGLGYNCHAISGDISNYEFCQSLIQETVEHFGQLDILINNAGLAMEGRIEDTKPEVFKQVFNVNILGVLYPSKAALPYLSKTKGSIIITGSIAGFMGLPEFSAYSSSKMALTALAQSLRIETAPAGIHVGLNYVGFAENDVDKTFINKEGDIEKMPKRDSFKRMSMEQVANKFVSGIEKRKKQQILSALGKGTSFMYRFFPRIFEKIMIRRYIKIQREAS